MRVTWASVLVLGLAVAATAKDSDKPIVTGDLGGQIEAAVEKAAPAFWGSVLVARGGEIVFAKGYGMADFDEAPCTPTTLFELASVSKQVTSAAVLHLAQRKKLSVDDTIDRFFKDVPSDKKGITVHQLLTHTSGLNPEGVGYADPVARDAYVKRMMAKPLVTDPGVTYAYSNVGYALLGCIVEEASKTSFEKYCEKHLFKPAGMKDTGFIGDRDLIKSKRVSVRRDASGTDRTAADWNWGWGYRGMGGVVTTVLDMHRWDQALRSDGVLDETTREIYYTPALNGYACGWNVATTERGTQRVSHTGGVKGYKTNYVRFLEDDAMFVVLGNVGNDAFAVARAIEPLLFEPVKMEALLDAGGYEMGEHGNVALGPKATWKASKKKGGLLLRLVDGKHVAMELRAPLGVASKLLADLDQAIATREPGDDGSPAAVEAGLYFVRYPRGVKKHELSAGLAVSIKPEYRGRGEDGAPIVDERVLFVLDDRKSGAWPVMVKMNVNAAKAMRAAIGKVVD